MSTVDFADIFKVPTGATGLSSGSYTDVDDGLPWSDSTTCYIQLANNGVGTVTFTGFNLSAAPGAKKGFKMWIRMRCNSAGGFGIDTLKLIDAGGPTDLWTFDGDPDTIRISNTSQTTYMIEVPDSAFSGDPDIDNLTISLTIKNKSGGNNRLIFSSVWLSKSPYDTADEYVLPSELTGKTFNAFRADDIIDVFGGADNDGIDVFPDLSGSGRHHVRHVGTTTTIQTGTPNYVPFTAAAANRFIAARGWDPSTGNVDRITGDSLVAMRVRPTGVPGEGLAQAYHDVSSEFIGVNGVSDKRTLATQTDSGVTHWLIMVGDGTGGAHIVGTTVVVEDVYIWLFLVTRQSSNDLLYLNDSTTPEIDAAGSGSTNDWYTTSLGMRSTDDRPGDFDLNFYLEVDVTGVSDADLESVFDKLVNGTGGPIDETGRQVSATSTVTSTDVTRRVDTGLLVSVSGTVTVTGGVRSVETAREVAVASTVTGADVLRTVETARSVDVASTVTSADVASLVDQTEVAATGTITTTDQARGVETVQVDITSTITETDVLGGGGGQQYDETGREVSASSAVSGADVLRMADVPQVAVASTTLAQDTWAGVDVGDTSGTVTVTSTDNLAGTEATAVVVVSTVDATDSLSGDLDETGRQVVATATVTGTDVLASVDVALVAVASSVSSMDALASGDAVEVAGMVTVTSSDGMGYGEAVLIPVASTITGGESWTGTEPGAVVGSVFVSGTDHLAATNAVTVTVTCSVSVVDLLTGSGPPFVPDPSPFVPDPSDYA